MKKKTHEEIEKVVLEFSPSLSFTFSLYESQTIIRSRNITIFIFCEKKNIIFFHI